MSAFATFNPTQEDAQNTIVVKDELSGNQIKVEWQNDEMLSRWQAWELYQQLLTAQSLMSMYHSTLGIDSIDAGYRSGT